MLKHVYKQICSISVQLSATYILPSLLPAVSLPVLLPLFLSFSKFTSCSSHQTDNIVCREPVPFLVFVVLKAICEVKVKVAQTCPTLVDPMG